MKHFAFGILAVGFWGCASAGGPSMNTWIEITDTASVYEDCLWMADLAEHYAIQDSVTYYSLLQYKVPEYDTCLLPPIDFSRYTLLGLKMNLGGCKPPTIVRKVLRNDTLRSYKYLIEVVEHGKCMKLFQRKNWLRVPKIADDYTINYEFSGTTDSL